MHAFHGVFDLHRGWRDQPASIMSIEELGERDSWRCHFCGFHVERDKASRDHLIPLALGGITASWNLALTHKRCNSIKRATFSLGAFLRALGLYLSEAEAA